ncbi:MAG TPA: hypothetical protein VF618_25320 [Thermoanaerobaculia bacterium]
MLYSIADLPGHLSSAAPPPCLSLYQRTHRHHPHNQQDPIRFRNLVRELESSLVRQYPAEEARELLAPFHKLAADSSFWNHTLDGLGVLAADGVFRVYRLQRPVDEVAIVADSFHTKPLRRFLQSVDRFQVLSLTRREIGLFEGNRDVLDTIELAPGVPRTIVEALGDELTEPHLAVGSYNGAGGSAMYHGHGDRKDETAIDEERFFRAVDRAILTHHSRPSALPLILAGLPEQQATFRQVSHNPFLVAAGIDTHPRGMGAEELRQLAWQTMEPEYRARLGRLAESFRQARANGFGSEDVAEVARAAATGRVATLLVADGRHIPARLDAASGEIEPADLQNPDVDDLLDDLGSLVEAMGGRVYVLQAEAMPTASGVAAVFRY